MPKKQKQEIQNEEPIDISQTTLVSELDNNTTLITSEQKFQQAMYNLEKQDYTHTAYLNDVSIGGSTLSNKDLEDLADNTQTNILKVQRINTYVRKEINKNDLIGKTYEAIETNLNTKIELIFNSYSENRNKNIIKERAEEIIKDFNEAINLEDLITKVVPMTYAEGNYYMYLRDENDDYQVDYYPLGVAEVSDYEKSGEPYLLININELTSRLRKINKKNKDGSYLFFKNIDEEILNNYPKEVYDAYKSNNQYARLNIENSGIIRVNNLNRKYGVTPIFRALKSSLMLESFKLSDETNNKARGKKIIFQKTDSILLKDNPTLRPVDHIRYSHLELLTSLSKNDVSVYTGMPWVQSVEYVEPKILPTNVQNITVYKNEIATALGISYLVSEKTGIAEVSIGQLMKYINKITTQLEKVLKKFYRKVLKNNGIPSEFVPSIKIIDSELLDMKIRLELADALFNKYGASYKTIYELLDRDFVQEEERRIDENNKKMEKTFIPRLTGYTTNAKSLEGTDSKGGRPSDTNNKDKQEYDQNYNKDNTRVAELEIDSNKEIVEEVNVQLNKEGDLD